MSSPLFCKDASVTIALVGPPAGTSAEYNCDVHSAAIETKAGDDVSYQTLCPDGTYTQKGASTYSLHLVGVQDWDADGLSRFLWDHQGELATFVVQAHGAAVPIAADAPGFTGQIALIPGDYGGEADTWAEFDVTLPCTTKPTLITAPPTVLAAEAAPEAAPAEAAA